MRLFLMTWLLAACVGAAAQAPEGQRMIPDDAQFAAGEQPFGFSIKGEVRGVKYRRWPSGTAAFQGSADADVNLWQNEADDRFWSVTCRTDKMTDLVTCRAIRGTLILTALPDGNTGVGVLDHEHPSERAMLRVDKNQAIQADPGTGGIFYTDKKLKRLLAEMRSGRVAATRHYEWPSKVPVDGSVDLFGFAQAMDYALWAVKQAAKK